jgi:hypothetical protein
VLRGGSFNNNDQNVRCGVRNNNNPNNRNNNIGFRVILSTFLAWRILSRRHCLPGTALQAEVINGRVCSRPCLLHLKSGEQQAGQIAAVPHPGLDSGAGPTTI